MALVASSRPIKDTKVSVSSGDVRDSKSLKYIVVLDVLMKNVATRY